MNIQRHQSVTPLKYKSARASPKEKLSPDKPHQWHSKLQDMRAKASQTPLLPKLVDKINVKFQNQNISKNQMKDSSQTMDNREDIRKKTRLAVQRTPQPALTSRRSSVESRDSSIEKNPRVAKKISNIMINRFLGDLPYGEKPLSYRKDEEKY